jgi:ABC-type lipoprotein export system ATPase subunit
MKFTRSGKMSAENLFILKNVICAYIKGRPVLSIPLLEIPRGKLIAVIGKSGSGKSTLLETLGLMNNTLVEGEISFQPSDDMRFNIAELWSNTTQLAEIRNKYLSFIFQDTNLMSNFTAVENACIPQLIQGIPIDVAKEHVKETMTRLGIGNLDQDIKVFQLSGGQKQRIAFVRAITAEFFLLFGDEPTGNLDKKNAHELMLVIKQYIHEHKRSSIIVSHDINLSVEFADLIMIITKDGETGEILPENIFHCKSDNGDKTWYDNRDINVEDIKAYINDKLL